MTTVSVFVEKLAKCYLPKLSRDLELSETHCEFEKWDRNLIEHFPTLINLLNDFNLKECTAPQTVISSLLLLYFQLHSEGQWKTEKCEEYAQKLNCQFQLIYDTTLSNLLKTNKVYDPQKIFDDCMVTLHKKLTPDDIKKYPALIEAYYFIVMDLEGYDISLNPASVLPISLLLIEDYVIENRLKGLKCCSCILQCLTIGHFLEGNYYEVVYRVLKKTLSERNIDVTKLVLDCLADLLRSLPLHSKVTKIDEVIGIILEQMYTETNLYRKKEFFIFLNKIIHIHGVHCVKRNLFLPVICDNLEICTNKFVAEIILFDVLECLENWIKYCWCVWKLPQNQKLVTELIKNLYVSCKEEATATKIFNNFTVLCKLCSEEEQKEIACDLEKSIQATKNKNETFAKILQEIKNHIT